MNKTFNELVWELVSQARINSIVVDNHHAYGIILHGVDSLWDQMRSLGPEDDHQVLLPAFVNLAVCTQLAAENLALVPEQTDIDDRYKDAEKKVEDLKTLLRVIINSMDAHKQPARAHQLGSNRFAYEFDESFLDTLKQNLENF